MGVHQQTGDSDKRDIHNRQHETQAKHHENKVKSAELFIDSGRSLFFLFGLICRSAGVRKGLVSFGRQQPHGDGFTIFRRSGMTCLFAMHQTAKIASMHEIHYNILFLFRDIHLQIVVIIFAVGVCVRTEIQIIVISVYRLSVVGLVSFLADQFFALFFFSIRYARFSICYFFCCVFFFIFFYFQYSLSLLLYCSDIEPLSLLPLDVVVVALYIFLLFKKIKSISCGVSTARTRIKQICNQF